MFSSNQQQQQQQQATVEYIMQHADVLGVVATLGKVNDDKLGRLLSEYLGQDTMLSLVCMTYKGVIALETYGKEGIVSKSSRLHEIGASLERTMDGWFNVICIENLRPYIGEFIPDDPQRRLALLEPKLPNSESPEGFLGFAVNMIHLDIAHLVCLTSEGHGLRETLFYSLFLRLQVYRTREHMLQALPFLSDGAVSLDGEIIRNNGVYVFGTGDEIDVRFAISSYLPNDLLEIEKQMKRLKWRKETTVEELQREESILTQFPQQHFSQQPPQLSQSPQKEERKKVVTIKKVPWNNDEEVRLAECWLAASEDPKVGNAKTIDSFWYRVLDIYNEGMTIKRTKDQCSSKWRELHLRTKKFKDIYSRMVDERRLGESDDHILNRAHELYESESGQVYKCLHIWNVVKDKERWLSPDVVVLGRRNKKRNQGESFSSVPPIDLHQDEKYYEDPFHNDNDKNERSPYKPRQTKSPHTWSTCTTSASTSQIAQNVVDEMQCISQMKLERAKGKKELADHQMFILDMNFLKFDTTGMEDAERAFVEKKKYDIRKKYGIL